MCWVWFLVWSGILGCVSFRSCWWDLCGIWWVLLLCVGMCVNVGLVCWVVLVWLCVWCLLVCWCWVWCWLVCCLCFSVVVCCGVSYWVGRYGLWIIGCWLLWVFIDWFRCVSVLFGLVLWLVGVSVLCLFLFCGDWLECVVVLGLVLCKMLVGLGLLWFGLICC